MHPSAAAFVDSASERYGFEPPVEEFEAGTKTAADAAAAIGCDVAQIASSLAFECAGGEADGELVVVVTSGANRVDEAHLAGVHGVDALSMADADRIKAELGWSIGGVPPICHDVDVPLYVDETLLGFETVWAAAGTPEAVFAVDPEELLELTGGTVVPVTD